MLSLSTDELTFQHFIMCDLTLCVLFFKCFQAEKRDESIAETHIVNVRRGAAAQCFFLNHLCEVSGAFQYDQDV